MSFRFLNISVLFGIVLLCFSCQRELSHPARVILIQPLGHLPKATVQSVYTSLKTVGSTVVLRPAIALPQNAYYKPRNRYRAELLLQYLKAFGSADTVVIGLTEKDISITKNNVQDWGVMGLGYRPGNACVVSTFRLSKNNQASQFYKVAIHELGHTQGLPHCPNKTCFMRDANGGNPLNEETAFCPSCKRFLKAKGWTLK